MKEPQTEILKITKEAKLAFDKAKAILTVENGGRKPTSSETIIHLAKEAEK